MLNETEEQVRKRRKAEKEALNNLNKLFGGGNKRKSSKMGAYDIKENTGFCNPVDEETNRRVDIVICSNCLKDGNEGREYLEKRFGGVGNDYTLVSTRSQKPCRFCGKKYKKGG